MEGSYTKFRYSKWNGIQDLICFLVNYLFSFPEAILKVFHNLLYDKGDQNLHSTCSKSVNTEFSFDLGLHPFPKYYDDPLRIDEPKETKTHPLAPAYTPRPSIIPDRYKPLILPPILHADLANYYLYLPRFDGECDNINAEQHVQNVETFLDLFEVDE